MIAVSLNWPTLNYSLVHAGLARPASLRIENCGDEPTDVAIDVRLPGFAIPGRPVRLRLGVHEAREVGPEVVLQFVPDRFLNQLERSRAIVEVHVDGHVRERQPIWILAYNECSWQQGHEEALAAFVHPNNPAILALVGDATTALHRITETETFRLLRESGRPEGLDRVVHAAFEGVRTRHQLAYDYEPPSWETNSQKVRFPDEVVLSRVGTCIDLVLLVTSLLEHLLVGGPAQPLIVITSGPIQHALLACWRGRPSTPDAVIRCRQAVIEWVESGALLVVDAASLAVGNPFSSSPATFSVSVDRGRALVTRARELVAVNVGAVRPDYQTGRAGVTPLPSRCEPAYAESALQAFWYARQAWEAVAMAQIQTAHLLIGLLRVEDGAGRRLFETVARWTRNPLVAPDALLAYLEDGLRRYPGPGRDGPLETESFVAAKLNARLEAGRLGAMMVEDVHVLFALLRRPGTSMAKALTQRRSSTAECLTALDQLNPAPAGGRRSEFPSEMT